MSIEEPALMGEQVLRFLKKEDEMLNKPDDMQCSAMDDKTQCDGEKYIDTDLGVWVRWCKKHHTQEKTARVKGGERVKTKA